MTSVLNEGTLENEVVGNDLPLTFKVKYLGSEHARGLWGIKHTRRPVDHLVTMAKTMPTNKALPLCDLTVSRDGVFITTGCNTTKKWNYTIDSISYGVQDLVYTRVFAMIVVKDNFNIKDPNPFEVHAFVCDSRALARKLTYALAASFQEYSKRVKEIEQQELKNDSQTAKKKFAIDLRTPEEMRQTIDDQETEA
ncbi:uncharacterized protein LOC129578460 isoform X2 [Sitodiplosis mosellana]|nr:uncharacterized protein LOC129578460 isoform X2 [Sitodiplosis mosellana]XP_055323095.1 uncharacterized protein LOC129578460 isoform X2 [Sitodiplosis mosellana]XP_055323096.1 uncharacterized protein LOC129578460 isoform X2 [Sitodiplosis mosellana]